MQGSAVAEPTIASGSAPSKGRALARKTVLVVEDDAELRAALRGVLADHGYDVITANDGDEALAGLRSGGRPDAILLDLMLPVCDGWQFRVEQKRMPEVASIPVIAMTADRTAKASAIDADACLSKPLDVELLLTTLDRVFLVRERERMRAHLVEADRLTSLGTLAAGMAHEINNPLAYVIANVELISHELEGRDGVLTTSQTLTRAVAESRRERLHDALAQVRDGLERIRTIVSDLKTFSSPTSDGLVLVDLRRVLDSAANIVTTEVKHRGVLVKEYGDVPEVLANEARLGQVFMNLIVNAAQALDERFADRNRIYLVTRTLNNGRAVVEVRDTGSGIAPDVLGHIFEPFFTTKPLGVGTGLGLFICHNIVSSLGGSLAVVSELGKGSTFSVELPAADADAAAASRPLPKPASPRRGRVLVVDDEEMICRTFDSLLGGEHEVTALTSARAAYERIASGERFDLILSDVMMPGMSGIDLYRALVPIAPDQAARMVFLTGGAFTRAAREFTDTMRNTLIEKPFDWSALLDLVRERVG